MADRYWVGGSAAWSSTNTAAWSASSGGAGGASVPTSADNVFFNQAGTYTVTITGTGQACNDLTISAGTVTIAGSTSPSLSIYGNFSITASTVWGNIGGNGTNFNGTATRTINTNGATLNCPITIGSTPGGTYRLLSSLTIGSAFELLLRGGTLDLNGFSISTGTFSTQNAITYNNQARSIIFGTSNIYITSTTGSIYHVDMRIPTGLTISESGGGFVMNADVSRIVSFNGGQATTAGAASTNAPNIYFTTGSASIQIADTSEDAVTGVPFHKYKIVDFGQVSSTLGGGTNAKFVVRDLILSPNMNAAVAWPWYDYFGQTCTIKTNGNTTCGGTQIIKGQGLKLLDNCTLSKTSPAVPQFQLSAGTLDLNNFNLDNSGYYAKDAGVGTKAVNFGTGIWYAQYCTNSNVTGMTVTTNGGYMYMTNTTAQTYAWGTTGGSSTNALPVKFGFNSSTAVVTLTTNSWYRNLDFSATTFNLNAGAATTLNIAGNLILGGGTYTGLTANIVGSSEAKTITTSEKTIAALTINSPDSTVSLSGNLTTPATATTTLTAGTLALGDYNLTTGIFSSSNTNLRGLTSNNGRITLTFTTAATVNLSMADATNFTCSTTGTGGFAATANLTRTWTFGSTAGGTAANAPSIYIAAGTSAQTFTTGSWFNTFSMLGTGTTPTTSLNVNSVALGATGTYTSVTLTTRATGTVNTNGRTLASFNVNMTDPTHITTLQASVLVTATATCTLSQGTLKLNDFSLSCGVFNSDGTLQRRIEFGTGNINITNTNSAATAVAMATMTNFTCSATTGGFAGTPAVTRTWTIGSTAGGTNSNSPNLTFTSTGTSTQTVTSGSWINKLDFAATAVSTSTVTVNCNSINNPGSTTNTMTFNMVGTGTVSFGTGRYFGNINFNNPGGTTTLLSNIAPFAATQISTLTAGTIDLNGFQFQTGSFSSSNTNTRSIAFGTGTILLTNNTAGITSLDMADTTNLTCTGTGGFSATIAATKTFLVGTTGGSVTSAPNLLLTSGAAVPSFGSGSWFKSLNFTGTTSVPTAPLLYVDTLTLATGGTYTGIVPIFTRTQTWTPQFSKQLGGIGVGAAGATLTLEGTQTYVANAPCYVYAGTLNLGGGDRTFGIFSSTVTGVTRNVNFGTNNFIISNSVSFTDVLSVADATNFTFTGTGGFVCSDVSSRELRFRFATSNDSIVNPPSGVPNLTLNNAAAGNAVLYGNSKFKTLTLNTTNAIGDSFNTQPNIYVEDIVSSTQTYIRPMFTVNKSWSFGGANSTNIGRGFGIANGATVTAISAGNLGVDASSAIDIEQGTLNLNGYDIRVGQVISAPSTSTTRSIIFGDNYISLVHSTAGGYNINIGNVTNFTFTGAGGFNAAPDLAGSGRRFLCGSSSGGTSVNCPNLTFTGTATGTIEFQPGSWFNKVDFGTIGSTVNCSSAPGLYVNSLTYSSNAIGDLNFLWSMAGTGTLITKGKSIRRLTINHTGTTTLGDAANVGLSPFTTTVTSGNLDLNGFTLTTVLFNSDNTNTRSITFGNANIVVTNSSNTNSAIYIPNATGFTCTASTGGFVGYLGGFYFGNVSGGSSANSPNLTLTTGSMSSITVADSSWWNKLDFGATTGIGSSGGGDKFINSLALSTDATFTHGFRAVMSGTGTITSNGRSILQLTINHSGTTTLNDAAVVTNVVGTTLTSGTLNLNNKILTTSEFKSSSSSIRSVSGAGTIAVNGNWTITDGTGFTGTGYTINMTKATSKTFAGAGGAYGKLNQAGAGILTITGSNNFDDITATTLPSTVKIQAGSTQTVKNFTLSGTSGSLVTLQSTVNGTQYTLSDSIGYASVDYLSYQDANVTGGAQWYAKPWTNTSISNNTGWKEDSVVKGQFMAFF